jgi:hypothetical protein
MERNMFADNWDIFDLIAEIGVTQNNSIVHMLVLVDRQAYA